MNPIVKLIVDVLMFVRPLWVAPIVLPLSWIARWIEILSGGDFSVSLKQHRARVEKLAADVRTAKANGATRLCSDRSPHAQVATRTTGKFKRSCDARIDVSNFDRIVELNAKEKYVVVQPYVSIGTLTRKLSALNLQLPVTPEMDQLTVGGLCLGYGIESSSHVVGLFFDASVIEVEVVTANGKIVFCTRDNEHEDLFRALQWSYGTLGFAVTFKLRLIEAKPYIKLTLERIGSYEEAERRSVADVSKKNPHYYYEGLAFGPKHTALIYGDVIETLPAGAELYNPMKRWWEPFFHRFVEQKTRDATGPVTVYMPLRDYLHRYYRGLFWEVELLIPGANTYLFRLLFGWLCPPHTKHLKMLQTEEMFEQLNKDHIVQDVLVPVYELASTLHKCDEWFDIYPLWFVFHTAPGAGDMMRPDPRDPKKGLFVDVGIWGVPARVLSGKDKNFDGEARTRDLEAHLRSVTGLQTLYATTFQTEEQFNQMFDLTHYKRMRVKYDAETTFPTVFDKVRLRRN